jgi:hypothetical protein
MGTPIRLATSRAKTTDWDDQINPLQGKAGLRKTVAEHPSAQFPETGILKEMNRLSKRTLKKKEDMHAIQEGGTEPAFTASETIWQVVEQIRFRKRPATGRASRPQSPRHTVPALRTERRLFILGMVFSTDRTSPRENEIQEMTRKRPCQHIDAVVRLSSCSPSESGWDKILWPILDHLVKSHHAPFYETKDTYPSPAS